MKKSSKVIKTLIILLFLTLNCFNLVNVFATQSTVPDVNYYKPNEEQIPTEVTDVAGNIVTVIQVLGTIIAVISLMILGIKYMLAGVEERASYKKSMIPYLIGCILLFATVTIISAVYNVIKPLNS